MPNVRSAIEAQGGSVTDTPRKVSPADVERADIVVSIGCDLSDLSAEAIIEWDVPLLSVDLNASMNPIEKHAEALAESLQVQPGQPPAVAQATVQSGR